MKLLKMSYWKAVTVLSIFSKIKRLFRFEMDFSQGGSPVAKYKVLRYRKKSIIKAYTKV